MICRGTGEPIGTIRASFYDWTRERELGTVNRRPGVDDHGFPYQSPEFRMKQTVITMLAAFIFALAVPAQADKSAGEVLDDNTVNASVKAALVGAKDVPSTDIQVETYRGVVLLSGFVETQAMKDKAAKVAQGVTGVQKLHNSIAVHPKTSMGTKLDDTVITSKVKTALMGDADVKSGQINVETKGGIVQLAGFVTGEGMRKRALEVAAKIEGVKKVENALYVKPAE
jgi:hyperosmotically inducible protein